MYIYRIQDVDGRGPFKPGFSRKWVCEREDHQNLKSWLDEFGPVHLQAIVGSSVGSGCKTIEQFRRWFTRREYNKLKKFGYRAVKFKIDRILGESDTQCLFSRAKPLNEDLEVIRLY